ncbi:MAG: PHP-associated domain-containing protein [Pyramidobacter sp.]|nr:PHP-associated domain-containing protein [Pyramidobacter sp.]
MIVDTHMHTAEFSPDSFLPVAQAVARAREMGVDALCVTDHDTLSARSVIERWRQELQFPLFLGAEVLTTDGDFVCFGLDSVPGPREISAQELLRRVALCGAAAVAAHPFRNNGRGARELIAALEGLAGIECFNGSTPPAENLRALRLARARGAALCGAGDAHHRERVALYATRFPGTLRGEADLIAALRSGHGEPLAWDGERFVDAEARCESLLAQRNAESL